MKNLKLKNLFILCLLAASTAFAQDELWYFGRGNVFNGAGLQFPGPTARNLECFSIYEAITVISDGSGNALFYSDGLKVFNKNNVQMPSGGGLLGSQESNVAPTTGSSLNGVVAFKKPGSLTEYYIFTINDCLNSTRNGVRYNIVDMTQNGGLGDVTSKNNIVLDGSTTPTGEMMTAASKPCSDTIWVVVHGAGNNNFYAIPVSPAGVGAPVVTSTGPNVGINDDRRGSFAFNSDASQLAMASMNGNGGFIFNFDASTGVVSTTNVGAGGTSRVSTSGHYGCAWSPDDKKVYFTSLNSNFVHFNTTLAYSPGTNPSVVTNGFYGAVKKGADGKLYVGENMTNFLGTVSTPNAADAATCGWNPTGFAVGTLSWYGLPNNFIPQSGGGTPAHITNPLNDTTVCDNIAAFQLTAAELGGTWSSLPVGFVNSSGMFDPSAGSGAVKVYYGNPPCLMNDSVTITVNVCCPPVSTSAINDTCAGASINLTNHVVQGAGNWSIVSGTGGSIVGSTFTSNTAGSFTVRYTLSPDPGGSCTKYSEQTFDVIALPVISMANQNICVGDSTTFDAGNAGGTYVWSNQGTGTLQTTKAKTAGTYTVTVTNNGCSASGSATLSFKALPVISMADQNICTGDSTTFDAGNAGATYVWSNQGTGTSQTTKAKTAGTYTVSVTLNGCSASGSANLSFKTLPVVSMADQNICTGDSTTFDAGNAGATYVWSNQGTGTNQTTKAKTAGTYTVAVTANGCTASGSATLSLKSLPVISMANQSICTGDSTTFDAGNAGATYVWSNQGTGTNQTTKAKTAGTYTVAVTANGCTASGSATLSLKALPVISMADQNICTGDSTTFDAGNAGATYVWSNQGTGTNQTTKAKTAGTYTVAVTANGCTASGSATLSFKALPVISMADQNICTGDSTSFDAGNAGSTYVWSNQGTGTNQTTKAKIAGTYTVAVTLNGCTASGSAALTLKALPVISMSKQAICAGDSTTFDAGNIGSTYIWSNQGTGTNQTTKAKTAGTYTVEVTGINGCKNTASAVLTVNLLPTPILADASVCPGGFIVLQPSPATYAFYEWSTGASGANKDTIHYNKPNTTVWVKVTDANGCSDSAFANITMGDTLHVDFGGPKDVCADQSIVLNAAQFGSFTPVTHYTWTPAAPDQSTLAVTASGTYSVLVEDGRGCQGDAQVEVTIRPLPVVDLHDSSACFTGKEVINVSVLSGFKTYSWSTGSVQNNTSVLKPEKVKLIVTNNFDCAASDSAMFNEFCEPTQLCFPNMVTPNGDGNNDEFMPCKDDMILINDGNYKSIVNNILHIDLQIYDRWGVRVFQSLNSLPSWDCTYLGNRVAPAVYYYVVRYSDSAKNDYEQTGWVQVVAPE